MAACDVGLLLYPDDGIRHFCRCPGRFSECLRCGVPVGPASKFPSLESPIVKYGLGRTCDPNFTPMRLRQPCGEFYEEVSAAEETARHQQLRAIAGGELGFHDLHAPKLEAAARAAMAAAERST